MKAIMISIKPEWNGKILNREKTLEIRTTCPKEWKDYLSGKTNVKPEPIKVYDYCTFGDMKTNYMLNKRGKVVAEFTLKQVDKLEFRHLSVSHTNAYIPVNADADYQWEKHCCVDYKDIIEYGKLAPLYAWHIDDLKIYDEPKELNRFTRMVSEPFGTWHYNHREKLTRPPQSWCYVEQN